MYYCSLYVTAIVCVTITENSDILLYSFLQSWLQYTVCVHDFKLIRNAWCLYLFYKFNTYHDNTSVIVTELSGLCSHAAFYCNWLVVIIQNNGKKLVITHY